MLKRTLLASAIAIGMMSAPIALSTAAAKVSGALATPEEMATRPAIPQVSVSPDGKKVAYRVAQTKMGDYAIEVRDIQNLGKDPVRLGSKRMDITGFRWISDDQLLVDFIQQTGRQVKQQNVGTFRGLTAIMNADGSGRPIELYDDLEIVAALPDDPKHVLVETNRSRNLTFEDMKRKGMSISDAVNPDIYKMNVETGALRKFSSPGAIQVVSRSADGNPAVGIEFRADRAGDVYYLADRDTGEWEELITLPSSDMTAKFSILGGHPTKDGVLLVSTNITPSGTSEYQEVYEVDSETKSFKKMWSKPGQDIVSAVYDPRPQESGRVVGFVYYGKDDGLRKIRWLSRSAKTRHDNVAGAFPGKDVRLGRSDRDGDTYNVIVSEGTGIASHYIVDGDSVLPLGPARGLDDSQMSPQKYIEYPSKDGSVMVPAYVTVPKTGSAPYPAIVMPHGGPFVFWRPTGFDEWTQFLAANGYVVIDPLFRGTEGLGRSFLEGGYANWGEEMNDDMDAAIPYLAKQGLIDPNKVAMFGWSHGGYAAVAAAIRSPQVYQCTIPGAAVSDIGQQNSGFADSRRARRFLGKTYAGLNPVKHIDKVSVPMLIIHGELDQRVMLEQSDILVKELEKHNKPFRKLYLEKADHFSNTLTYENRLEMYKEMLDFLGDECGM